MNTQFVQGDALFARINNISKKYEYLSQNIDCDVIIRRVMLFYILHVKVI